MITLQKSKRKLKPSLWGDDVVRYAITRGLRPFIKAHVIHANAKTLEEVLDRARAAELTEVHQPPGRDKINEEIRTNHRLLENEIKKLADRMGNISVHAIDRDDESSARYRSRSPKRVTFDDRSRSPAPTAYRHEADVPFGTQTRTEFAYGGQGHIAMSQHEDRFRSRSPCRHPRPFGGRGGRDDRIRPSYVQPPRFERMAESREQGRERSWQPRSPRYNSQNAGNFPHTRGPQRRIECWECGGNHMARDCNRSRRQPTPHTAASRE